MSGVTYDYMEEYIRGLIPESEGKLKELEDFAKENGVPIAQKETIKFLEFMVSMKKPLRILELGTAIGYSAIIMYEAAGCNPHITTIEAGDCLEVLERLEEPYDLIFMDAGKGHYNHFLPHCLRLLKDDGIIIADNVLFRGMVASDDLVKRRKITIVKRMRTYLDLVSQDKDLITSVIPMGDGIAITRRR